MSGPIGVVFTPDIMTRYLMLFNTLWRAKRMEWVLSGVWRKLAYIQKVDSLGTKLNDDLSIQRWELLYCGYRY